MSQEYCAANTADDFGALFPDDICAGNALDENENGLIDGGIDSCQGRKIIHQNYYFRYKAIREDH